MRLCCASDPTADAYRNSRMKSSAKLVSACRFAASLRRQQYGGARKMSRRACAPRHRPAMKEANAGAKIERPALL